ncbi:Dehydroquinase [Parathielavia appendiculata]|uniref:Catabolic 3-dehydroquinase n=1 Tax=Parathielavia appendiculata TaxID=2587402 RepID=A0AAN6U0S3_9PEZI|nr:Dehydroquinase [Parathielavia appendiculata]
MTRRILLINGPNLNLLGKREPHIYGSTTLVDIEAQAHAQAASLGISLETFQSNHEGAIVDRIQEAAGWAPLKSSNAPSADSDGGQGNIHKLSRVSAIIINPGALTHMSVAVRDALLGVAIPFVELHVSNVYAREPWRKHSYFSDRAVAVICGMGAYGYSAAIEFAAKHMRVQEGDE